MEKTDAISHATVLVSKEVHVEDGGGTQRTLRLIRTKHRHDVDAHLVTIDDRK